MKNLVQQSGENLTVIAPYDVVSGDGVQVGIVFGVASTTALAGNPVVISTVGVYDLKKTAGQAATAFATPLYWDNAARSVTAVASTHLKIGVPTAGAVGGDATARTRLNGTF